ncbi:MAG TPA: DoxX family protein [Planctomycetota bacterium]|nr:DoxX family protein [Planctomycetota bacterium]
MSPDQTPPAVSKARLWTGRVLSSILAVLLGFDAVSKLLKLDAVVRGTVELGYSESVIVPLGVVLLLCTLLYAVPRTAIFGAILLTGYLGGAVATHVRIGNPWMTHILFPVYVGVLLWVALTLRDSRLEALLFSKARRKA